MQSDEALELRDERARLTELEIRVDAIFESGEAFLFESSGDCLCRGAGRELRERRATPQRERVSQLGRALGCRETPCFGNQAPEPVYVAATRLNA